MKIWLDDIRQEPDGWVRTTHPDEVIGLLLSHPGEIDEMSLDHDLAIEHYSGDYSRSPAGYTVLEWLEQELHYYGLTRIVKVPEVIRAHSDNPPARARMQQAVRSIQKKEHELRGGS